MSHFTVLVIAEDPEKLSDLLAPYQENNMGDCPEEYLQFNDEEQAYRDSYETGSARRVKLGNGEIVDRYDDRFYVVDENNRRAYKLPEGAEETDVPIKELYPSADAYVEAECDYEVDEKTGKRGYWENQNRKWDWYQVGGRWNGSLLLKNGERVNEAQVKDIFFIGNTTVDVTDPIEDIHKATSEEYATIAGYTVPAELAPTIQKIVDDATKGWESLMAGKSYYKPEYLIERYGDVDGYIKDSLQFSTFAVLTPDGKWHEKGEMGWWGLSSDTPEEAKAFNESYYETFIKNANPEHYMIVVDCHI